MCDSDANESCGAESTASESGSSKKFTSSKLARVLADICSGRAEEKIDSEDVPNDIALDDDAKSRATTLFNEHCRQAESIVEDYDSVKSLLDSLKNWTNRFAQKFNSESFQSLTTVFRMLNSAVTGEYQGLSKSTIACLLGCVVYCVSPIDAIPDSIPVVGLFDDAFVLSWTLNRIADELKTFRMWERLKTAKSILASYLPYFSDVKRVTLAPGWMTADDDFAEETEILQPVFPNATFDYFRWDSNCSWSTARDYADQEGPKELAEFLRKGGDLASSVVVAHSLGARMTVRALALLASEPVKKGFWARKPVNRLGQAFLFGAAVDAEDPQLPLAAKGVNAPLCNFYSRDDLVLSYLYRAFEQKAPLGLSGLVDRQCDNYVDCVVSGHEEYWIDFAKNAAAVLAFVKSSSLLTKFSLAEALGSGLPEYYGHQFKRYARFFKESVLHDGESDDQSASEALDD